MINELAKQLENTIWVCSEPNWNVKVEEKTLPPDIAHVLRQSEIEGPVVFLIKIAIKDVDPEGSFAQAQFSEFDQCNDDDPANTFVGFQTIISKQEVEKIPKTEFVEYCKLLVLSLKMIIERENL